MLILRILTIIGAKHYELDFMFGERTRLRECSGTVPRATVLAVLVFVSSQCVDCPTEADAVPDSSRSRRSL